MTTHSITGKFKKLEGYLAIAMLECPVDMDKIRQKIFQFGVECEKEGKVVNFDELSAWMNIQLTDCTSNAEEVKQKIFEFGESCVGENKLIFSWMVENGMEEIITADEKELINLLGRTEVAVKTLKILRKAILRARAEEFEELTRNKPEEHYIL